MTSLPEYHVTITAPSESRLQVVWSQGPSDFEPYLIDRGSIRRISADVRTALKRLVARGMTPIQQGDPPPLALSGDLLIALAEQGVRLRKALFLPEANSVGDPEEVVRWLRDRKPARLLFRVEDRIHIPWGLMFDSDPAHLPRAVDDIGVDHYQDFWCIKHNVSTVYFRKPPRDIGSGYPAASFRMLSALNRRAFDNAVAQLRTREKRLADWMFSDPERVTYDKKSLLEKWSSFADDVGLLYFYCHANQTVLEFGPEDRLNVDDFKQAIRKRNGLPSIPCLVFLNGCHTAEGDIDGGFLEATSGPGFCGFIGTEAKLPDLFALRFSLEFYYLLLRGGLPLFQIMSEMRRRHWPLSLVYNMYCHDAFSVAPINPKRPVRPRSNYSLMVPLGTGQL